MPTKLLVDLRATLPHRLDTERSLDYHLDFIASLGPSLGEGQDERLS